MPQSELLDMLASETDRRCETIIKGVESLAESGSADADSLESLRVEAHGLKGAAMVVGQARLAELARRIESVFAEHREAGKAIEPALADKLVAATRALHDAATAVANGADEPPALAAALDSLDSA
jgi:chemotaxis protein histidine kinase CheA